jgi:hypothetical protein
MDWLKDIPLCSLWFQGSGVFAKSPLVVIASRPTIFLAAWQSPWLQSDQIASLAPLGRNDSQWLFLPWRFSQ